MKKLNITSKEFLNRHLVSICTFIFLFIIASCFWLNCNRTIQRLSPTYDEPLHLMQGYVYLKTNSTTIIRPDDHPILAKIIAAAGLLLLRPQPAVYTSHTFWENRQRYSFANLMLYYNNHDAEKLLNTGRKCIILVSTLFIFVYFTLIKNISDIKTALIASSLYGFNTSIVAHSCLVTQDAIASMIYFLAFFYFIKFVISETKTKYLLLCSIFTGLMMVTKYTVAVLLFSYFVILCYMWYTKKFCLKEIVKFFFCQFCGILLIAVVVYNKNLFELFNGFIRVIEITQQGRSTFFFGKYSTKGFLLYFPSLFLVKTELPLLILWFLSLVKFLYEVKKNKVASVDALVISGILIFIFIASLSKMQIGHRHILPVYPLVIWQAAKLSNFKKLEYVCYLMVLWNIFISIKTHPRYLSYFNEFIGGGKNAWKYFTDSNIDWGQGLKELGEWVRNHSLADKGIYFSYFGVGDPKYYGIKYRPIGFVSNLTNEERVGEDITKNGIERIIIAVSVTNLQSTYYKDKTVFNFLKGLNPVYVCSDSIFIYDITKHKEIIEKFVQLLLQLNYTEDVEYIRRKFLLN